MERKKMVKLIQKVVLTAIHLLQTKAMEIRLSKIVELAWM